MADEGEKSTQTSGGLFNLTDIAKAGGDAAAKGVQFLGDVAKEFKKISSEMAPIKSGAATYIYDVKGESFDVVKDYTWTLSKKIDEVPVVKLVEFEVDESTIVNQISYYASGLSNQLKGNTDPMAPYENLFPQKSTAV